MKIFQKKSPYIMIIVILVYFGCQYTGHAQVTGPQEIKWMRVGSLRTWFSNAGSEIEYGRRGRTPVTESPDQTDGMRWPAQYQFVDHCVSKSIRVGTTNYDDPVMNVTFPHKVVSCGTREAYLETELMPYEFKMIGRFDHPVVSVDGLPGTDNVLNDVVDEIDNTLLSDRLIVNKLHSSIGVDITRKIYAFSQQYHDNYFIYEYTFKNTGIIDLNNTIVEKTLMNVVFHFQYRYAFGYQAYRQGWAFGGQGWGRNCMNDVVGQDPTTSDFEFRALLAWHGPQSLSPGWADDVGLPDHRNGRIMSAIQYVGCVTIHADKSVQDRSDDPYQPTTTQYLGSDKDAQPVYQYNTNLMTRKYNYMTAGHPELTHAQEVGNGFANKWGDDNGGYASAHGYGPYQLEPGDSIRIVLAEGICGISREKNREVIYHWFNDEGPFIRPTGSTTSDRNTYKNEWVWSGKDSLFQTFRRAISNYKSGFDIPQPPPPPDNFEIKSGGNSITLTWSNSAESWPAFDGYQIYRGIGKADTSYQMIFSCAKGNSVNQFEDETAQRGFDYYYYIVTKDDGSTNDIQPGVPLASSKFYTMTNQPAYLRRPPANKLSEIRVVPNPYNIRAQDLQFGVDTPDRLAFFGLPPTCTIKIYTERGDLINTIEHTDGSGDEYWDSMTSSRQLVVSGLYIAYFEVIGDFHDPETGELLFKKGDHAYKKFIVIR